MRSVLHPRFGLVTNKRQGASFILDYKRVKPERFLPVKKAHTMKHELLPEGSIEEL